MGKIEFANLPTATLVSNSLIRMQTGRVRLELSALQTDKAMNFYNHGRAESMTKNVVIFPATVLAIGILAGCSGGGEPESAEGSDDGSGQSVQSNPQARGSSGNVRDSSPDVTELSDDKPIIEAQRLRGGSETDSGGLDYVIFASERQEYRDSLRLIAENSTDKHYQQLDAALRWLMINDPSIMNDEQRLLELIDGKTGREVLELVSERVAGPRQ